MNDSPVQAEQETAGSYERVSTRIQGQRGFSLGAQRLSMAEFAAANGWNLPEHLRFRDGEDENASGADWDLPGLTAMLEAARRHEFTVLVVPDLDRFARSLVKGLVLEEQLRKHGVRVAYLRVPVEDSPEGRLLKHQLFSFAEFEREKILLRTMTGKIEKARRGQVVGGGPPPYGYRFTYETLRDGRQRVCGLEPDPVTAPIVQRILRALPTRSLAEMQRQLNDEGIPGPRGGRWHFRTIHRMARDTVYRGEWRYGKQGTATVTAVPVPALIDDDTFNAIQAAIQRRKIARRGRRPREEDPYLLRSNLTCGKCHQLLITTPNNHIRYYACPSHKRSTARRLGKAECDLPDLHGPQLEAELHRVLTETLLDEDYLSAGLEAAQQEHTAADSLKRERLAALDTEVVRHRKRLDSLASRLVDVGEGEIYAALLRQAKDIETLLGRLTSERDEIAATQTDGLSSQDALTIREFAADIRSGLENATLAERHQIYELLRVRGTVYQDPNGIKIGRKHSFRIEWQAAIPLRNSVSVVST